MPIGPLDQFVASLNTLEGKLIKAKGREGKRVFQKIFWSKTLGDMTGMVSIQWKVSRTEYNLSY